jgi:Holliday junction resolvase RusA-like endonuclease
VKLTITVRDTPRPGGSKRAFYSKKSGRAFVVDASKHTKTWRESVRSAALHAYTGNPLKDAFAVMHIFYFKRPNSHFGSGKNIDVIKSSAPDFHTKKPDLTKLIRSTEDALTGIIWVDDSQVIMRTDEKRYASSDEFEGVKIIISTV